MLYDIEVRPGSGQDHFQYYTETVEANTSGDALARVQRMNPGCQLFLQGSYNDDGGFDMSGVDFGSSLTWCVILGGGLLFLYALPFIVAIGAIGLVCWGGYKLIKWILK